ncbi:YncE family protein [Myroides odoratimimus]|uniref:YncE family protein n=1 Tax=Myroides TaxID=76831 RepID=UPI00103B56D9|nr:MULTISPECIES: YncE family protein [Myroides]MDM1456564.1 YncE family protein [Myroides odoratimimus]MEC4084793.1 YncE family protein [Myroides odoratimimus]QBK77081.1 YncE family protein [Myroides odoratimimus]
MKYIKSLTFLSATVLAAMGTTATAQSIDQNKQVGKGLYEVAYNSVDNGVYVASVIDFKTKEGVVYKLNGNDLSVEKEYSVNGNPVFGIAVNEKTQKIYGTNTTTNAVTVIDLKTGATKVIPGTNESGHNREIAIDEKTNTIYASDTQQDGKVWIIDGDKDVLKGYIDNTGIFTAGLTFDTKTKKLYAANMGTNEVAIIDPTTKKVIKKFASGGESPINVSIDESRRRLFVTNSSTGLTVLNADSGELLKVVKFKGGSLGVNYLPKQDKIVLANRESGKTVIVDGKTYEVVTELETGSHPNTVAVNKNTGVAYVTNKTKRMPKVEGQEAAVDTNGDTVSKVQL